ncbi:hypothetical protein [Psychrobacter sp. AOP3-A1-26]|uniref:hypothetical protein n=1 Tax=Psychrobacter sp. AOP3-A1-26 TaxID=3457700 RepID=UPI004035DA2B
MKYIKLLLIWSMTLLCISCSQFTGASEHSVALDRAVQTMNDAVDLCEEDENSIKDPELDDLQAMSKFSENTINAYIIYRSNINDQICLIQNGATPREYISAVALDSDTDYFTRRKAEHLFTTLLPYDFIDNINYINNLPNEERKKLQQIDYLNSSFNLLVTTRALRAYKKNIIK